jgi:DNA-binding transcriptional MerR regulator
MKISELASLVGVDPKTIRYYESIDLLPRPRRESNRYREYDSKDVDRLRLVAGARRLDFSLAEVREILDLRDRGEAPCLVLLEALEHKRREIRERISELKVLETQLAELHAQGLTFPTDDVEGKNCVCHLVGERAEPYAGGPVTKGRI